MNRSKLLAALRIMKHQIGAWERCLESLTDSELEQLIPKTIDRAVSDFQNAIKQNRSEEK